MDSKATSRGGLPCQRSPDIENSLTQYGRMSPSPYASHSAGANRDRARHANQRRPRATRIHPSMVKPS
jgi:hypothetical protein